MMDNTCVRNDELIQIGSNIKRIRLEKQINSRDLVREVQLKGVSITNYGLSKIEANKQHIKASQLRAIAEVLDVDCKELLKRADEIKGSDSDNSNY